MTTNNKKRLATVVLLIFSVLAATNYYLGLGISPGYAGLMLVLDILMVLVYGTSCLQVAVVDSLTRKVHFPPPVVSITTDHVGSCGNSKYNALRHTFGSRVRADAYTSAVPRPVELVVGYTAKYDDASWHYGRDFPKDLPSEAGATHTAMFVAWALLSGLGGAIHIVDSPDDIPSLRARSISPRAFYLSACGGKFTDEDLSAEGEAFVEWYFDSGRGQYLQDYRTVLGGTLPSLYHVADSWESYDTLRSTLDRRLDEWRRASRPNPARSSSAARALGE